MARSKANTVTVMEDTSIDRVIAAAVSQVLVVAPPWALAILAMIASAIFHKLWGALAWASYGLLPPTVLLTVLAWLTAHSRGWLGRAHITATPAVVGLWMALATANGPFAAGLMSYLTVIGWGTLALTWNIRRVIRSHNDGRGQDILGAAFEVKAEVVGLPDSRMHTLKTGAHKILARLVTPPGSKTIEDMQRKRGQIEAGLELPPGSVAVAIDEDHAGHALVTVTDPRLMRKPIPWPGPSRPGKSIAEPLRPGVYQDGDEVAYTVLEHHLLSMGCTGSGKSFGGLWNIDAEAITRADVALWVADITKKTQTVGAFAPAIDWLAITKKDALAMLDTVQAVIGPRTAYLAKKRLKGWVPGCGLTFLMVHMEEASDIFDAMTDKQIEKFVSTMRAARSAGIWLNISLQRAIWNQLDTNARAQFTGFMCFGVSSGDDTKYGLPEHVVDAGATPERWLSNRPGSYYLAAPGIPDEKQAIPARGYLITDKEMRAHAEAFPASGRPLDEVTVRAAGKVYAGRTAPVTLVEEAEEDEPVEEQDLLDDVEQGDEEETNVAAEYLRTEDPDPAVAVDEDEEVAVPEDDEGFTFTQPGQKMGPDEAAGELLAQLVAWAEDERESFAPRDLRPVLERTGYKRGWIQKQLARLIEEGVIDHGENAGSYVILKAPAAV